MKHPQFQKSKAREKRSFDHSSAMPVKGYEDLYKIDQYGVIWSNKWDRVKATVIDTRGYERVSFKKDGKVKTYLVSRLMLLTFLDTINADVLTVNHINGNKLDNTLPNLEWTTFKENIVHARKTGLNTSKGRKSQLSEDLKILIIKLKNTSLKTKEILEVTGLKESTYYKYLKTIKQAQRLAA